MNDPTTSATSPTTVAGPDAPDAADPLRATDPRSGWLWVSAGVLAGAHVQCLCRNY